MKDKIRNMVQAILLESFQEDNEEIQTYVDIIDMNPDSEKNKKYIQTLKDKFS